MPREMRFVRRSLWNGLAQIFRSSPFLAFGTVLTMIVISSVIPCAFIWLVQYFLIDSSCLPIQSPFLRLFFTSWSIIEVLFLIYQCYLYKKVQQRTSPPKFSSKERDRLVAYALANTTNVSKTVSKWFMDSPFEEIDRESIVDWLAFAFYSKNVNELHDHEYQEIGNFMEKIEIEHQIKPSMNKSNKTLSFMRHILDPVRVIFRPLAFYFVTDTILNGIIIRAVFYFRGYQFVQIGHLQFWTFYQKSDDGTVEEEPIVFFHGLGAGLLTYQPLISHIDQKFSQNRRIILISMRCISMRYPSLNNIPNINETSESIKEIFEYYQIKKAIFIGHSYGTVCLSWIVQKCPEYISRMIFIDPICFSLFEPYVVYNFVYRTPYKLGHLWMFYFVCREMGISYVVSRHFWWMHNNLHIEQLHSCSEEKFPIYVLLAERDCIVNTHQVKEYLANYNIDCYWVPDISHGGYMHDKNCWKKICQWIS